jgi:hypothetical protein
MRLSTLLVVKDPNRVSKGIANNLLNGIEK